MASRANRWRIAAWGTAMTLLLLPLVAMRVTDGVRWDVADFALAGGLVLGIGIAWELAVRRTVDRTYRAAAAVALAAAFLLVWANAAVGIIGSEDNPANRMYSGVLTVGVLGAVLARFRPMGLARTMAATAAAQALVAVIALAAGMGSAPGITTFFVALWLLSAWLFRSAARRELRGPDAPDPAAHS
jgi:hypothetical protein